MAQDETEIAQISFYLSKEGRDFSTVFDPEQNVLAKGSTKSFDFDVEGASCRFLYFETTTQRKNPPWLDFANDKLPEDQQIVFKASSNNPNGILLILMDQRVFAASFGRSAASYLDQRAFEPDFGIKTAMNMCGNEEIRQTKSQSNTVTPTQIDRQVNKPADSFAFGLSEAEDLRYISAHMRGDKNVTLQGRDSLTIKVIGANKLTWPLLVAQCEAFLAAFELKDYATLFPNYKNFSEATPEQAADLDAVLIGVLRAGDLDKIGLGIPEFLDDADFGFTYSNHAKRANDVYAYLDPIQLKELKLATITREKLVAKKIYAYSTEDDRVLSSKRWSLYRCMQFEHEMEGRYFVLSDGRWLQIDDDFNAEITRFVRDVIHEEPCEVIYAGIDISDDVAKMNKESIFNSRVCELRTQCILFDRAKLKIGLGRKDKEFCDILDLTDAGRVRIIHCKPFKDSSSLNHLFAQASFYCEAFLRDDVFLREIREHIRISASPSRAAYLEYIRDETEHIAGADYDVCLWLLYDHRAAVPERSSIPLMAQYELKLMHERLRKVWKFHDVVLRFVPVKTTNYKTSRLPKAA